MADGDARFDGARQRERRAPRRITVDNLQRAAMHYLERYAAPSMQLRRVLQRKIALSCRHHGDEPAQFAAMLDDVVARCLSSGLVDDARFAEARAASLRRKGQSARAVAAKLSAKGVARELAAQHSATDEGQERAAARVAAKRKRLGPWSRGDRVANRQKISPPWPARGFAWTSPAASSTVRAMRRKPERIVRRAASQPLIRAGYWRR